MAMFAILVDPSDSGSAARTVAVGNLLYPDAATAAQVAEAASAAFGATLRRLRPSIQNSLERMLTSDGSFKPLYLFDNIKTFRRSHQGL